MKLLYAPPSPFARKARVAIIEKGLEDRIELVMVNPMGDDATLLAANPLSKIPALILDDGRSLIDSALICEYLDGLSDTNPLIPNGSDRYRVLADAYLANGVLEAAVVCRLEMFRPEEIRWSVWLERQHKAIERGLKALETRVDSLGGAITLAQINLGILLEYLDFRLPDLDWRAAQPNLAAWQKTFSGRPAMVATRPEENPLA